jgi:hypothetical protein
LLTEKQAELQAELVGVIREAVPVQSSLDQMYERADRAYHRIAEILVELRHEFKGPNGEAHDLKGRSVGYRLAVREAYEHAGAHAGQPVPKRLTAGVAYWVKKILLERYGEATLFRLGVVRPLDNIAHQPAPSARCQLPDDPDRCLTAVVGLLNELATDPRVVPTREVVRSVLRAVRLLQVKVDAGGVRPATRMIDFEPSELEEAVG